MLDHATLIAATQRADHHDRESRRHDQAEMRRIDFFVMPGHSICFAQTA